MPRGIPKNKVKKEVEAKAVEVAAKWSPAPDMGEIKPPLPSVKDCAGCAHKKGIHYGGKSEWCNTSGCNCQGFK